MRAHRNPTRMAAIERATNDLVRRFHSRCPECDYPGFDLTERVPGLPCAWCGEPTRVVMTDVLACRSLVTGLSDRPAIRRRRIPAVRWVQSLDVDVPEDHRRGAND